MSYVLSIALFIAGMIAGFIIQMVFHKSKIVNGVLKVKHDEDTPYLFLELSKQDMNDIHHKDYVLLKVDVTRE